MRNMQSVYIYLHSLIIKYIPIIIPGWYDLPNMASDNRMADTQKSTATHVDFSMDCYKCLGTSFTNMAWVYTPSLISNYIASKV